MDLEKQKQMPVWGPYSKKYMGLSRVMKESAIPGARFDLVIYPTYANSSVPAPNVTVPSNYHPWQADPEGRYFQYRYELIWKDQLYADVEFLNWMRRPGASGWSITTTRTDRKIACSIYFQPLNTHR